MREIPDRPICYASSSKPLFLSEHGRGMLGWQVSSSSKPPLLAGNSPAWKEVWQINLNNKCITNRVCCSESPILLIGEDRKLNPDVETLQAIVNTENNNN